MSRAETEQDFLDIRGELRDAGFLRRQGKKEQNRPAKPLEFRTTSGFRVLVGRNNRQNDKLTRSADHRDIWLHTQKIHGSHVILCTGGREVDDDTIVEAAKLAAWFSQARRCQRPRGLHTSEEREEARRCPAQHGDLLHLPHRERGAGGGACEELQLS